MYGNMESRIREIQLKGPGFRLTCGNQNPSSTDRDWNLVPSNRPDSTTWNPQSKTVDLNSLRGTGCNSVCLMVRGKKKRKEEKRNQKEKKKRKGKKKEKKVYVPDEKECDNNRQQ